MTKTAESRPLYRAGEKPSSLGKYGPGAVRDVAFLDKGGNGKPLVSVKQRKNGQYVVVEKLPTKNFLQTGKFQTVTQSLEETGVKFRSLKPAWKTTSKNYNSAPPSQTQPNPYVGHYAPRSWKYAQSLPPIDLGWKAEAMVGSLLNAEHVPGGGDNRIFTERPKWKAKAKVGSLDNIDFNQERLKTTQSDPSSKKLSSRYGALASMGVLTRHYNPSGAEVVKKNPLYKDVAPRVGSLDNASHVPGGGDINIVRRKLRWNAGARVGSLENVSHQPQGGDIYIVNNRLKWNPKPKVGSLENISHKPTVTVGKIPTAKTEWKSGPVVGSLDNIGHTPRGGDKVIPTRRLRWRAEAKINSLPPRYDNYMAEEDICKC